MRQNMKIAKVLRCVLRLVIEMLREESMSKQCIKCGYVRQPSDTAPDHECPKCGVIYAKAEAMAAAAAAAARAKASSSSCGRCGYTRQEIDTGPDYRCPKCGLLYGEEPSEGRVIGNKETSESSNSVSNSQASSANLKLILGILGSAVLFVGVFAPIVSVPVVGAMNYFQNGKGDGSIVMVLAVISFFLALSRNYKKLWISGLGSLAVMLFTFIRFQTKMSELKSQMDSDLAGNPFRGFADMAVQSIQLQWGWAVLVIGAVLVIAAAAVKE
jgi:predicted RNA-binding Zn-ribbon protein involved in translation (DUF1610 family)